MGAEINLNERLGEVGDTRDIRADGDINLTQGKGVLLSTSQVAGAGSTTTDATVTYSHHTAVYSTVASGGIRFDQFGQGDFKTVKNLAGAAVKVYPPTGGSIDLAATNAGLTLNSGIGASFYCMSANAIMAVKGS